MTRVSVCSGLLIPLPVHGKVCSREERQGGCSPFSCPQAGMNSSALGAGRIPGDLFSVRANASRMPCSDHGADLSWSKNLLKSSRSSVILHFGMDLINHLP